MEFLKKNLWALSIVTFIIGVVLGVVLYPSRRIEEQLKRKYEAELSKQTETLRAENKTLNQQLDEFHALATKISEEQQAEINQLRAQVREFESNSHEEEIQIIRADGSREIRRIKDTHTKELTKVTEEINSKWEKKFQEATTEFNHKVQSVQEQSQLLLATKEKEHQRIIEELKASKVTTINQKRFGLEAGVLTTRSFYGHATMDVAGPFFIGLQVQGLSATVPTAAGIGVGVRF